MKNAITRKHIVFRRQGCVKGATDQTSDRVV